MIPEVGRATFELRDLDQITYPGHWNGDIPKKIFSHQGFTCPSSCEQYLKFPRAICNCDGAPYKGEKKVAREIIFDHPGRLADHLKCTERNHRHNLHHTHTTFSDTQNVTNKWNELLQCQNLECKGHSMTAGFSPFELPTCGQLRGWANQRMDSCCLSSHPGVRGLFSASCIKGSSLDIRGCSAATRSR